MSPKSFEVVTRKYGSVESPSEEKKLIAKPRGKVCQQPETYSVSLLKRNIKWLLLNMIKLGQRNNN